MKRLIFPTCYFVVVLLVLGAPDLQAQCAMCKEAAERSLKDDPSSVARGLNKGILYLMAVPYLMIAFIFRKQLYMVWKKATSRFQKKTAQ
jgi:hypothetical protein